MEAITEDPNLTAELERLAASFQSTGREIFGREFDFSEASLTMLDELITEAYPNGNALNSTLLPFGSYVGETIRHNLGGVWMQTEDHGTALGNVGGQDSVSFPFTWVRKRFANGMEDSIAYKYAFVKSEVEKARGTPVENVPPRPYVPPVPMRGATEEELQRLARSPLLVLFLVAGADGKISKKELAAFEKTVNEFKEETSPLLFNALSWLAESYDAYLAQVESTEVPALEDLRLLAVTLRECFPADAGAYKHGLLDLGVKIAEASGGFFGLGNKVSAEELMALASIALALNEKAFPDCGGE